VFIPRGVRRGEHSPEGTNFTPGGQAHPWGPSSPLGAKFTPGGQVHPWGPSSPPLGAKLQTPPWGASSPLGTKLTPGGQVHHWGPGVKLRMALRSGSTTELCFKNRPQIRSPPSWREAAAPAALPAELRSGPRHRRKSCRARRAGSE
jgi:hypothetical protein